MSDVTTAPGETGATRQIVKGTAIVLVLLVNIGAVWLVVNRPNAPGPAAPVDPVAQEPVAQDPVVDTAPDTALETDGEVVVQVTPRASGTVSVVETIRTDTRVPVLLLQAPPMSPGDLVRPQVLSLNVEVDGRLLREQPPAQLTGAWLVTMPQPARAIVLRYELAGVAVRSRPAPDPRAMLTVRPLSSPGLDQSTTVVSVEGVVVHNLVCPERPVGEQLCGRRDGDTWRTADLPSADSTVVAQIDLPTTAA